MTKWITVPEAAKRLGCTRQHAYYLAKTGQLEKAEQYDKVVVSEASVTRYFEANQENTLKLAAEFDALCEAQPKALAEHLQLWLPVNTKARLMLKWQGGKQV